MIFPSLRLATRVALAAAALALAASLPAATFIPIRDGELYRRADVVVYGVVVSSDVVAGERWPETVTVVQPLRVMKGSVPASLVLRQVGGVLPEGRGFFLDGRPEYEPGQEVVVFAIANLSGDYQTAELLLGKFDVMTDANGRVFALPALARNRNRQTRILPPSRTYEEPGLRPDFEDFPSARISPRRFAVAEEPDSLGPARELAGFLDFLAAGGSGPAPVSREPQGDLTPIVHEENRRAVRPEFANYGDQTLPFARWFNNATAAFYMDGTANMTGGGLAEATAALAAWTNDTHSTINYSLTSDTSKLPIHMSAASAPCGWSTCFGPGDSGVVGCGGSPFTVPGSPCPAANQFRGDCYGEIMDFRPSFQDFPEVWLRCWTQANVLSSATTQAVLTHESGHTLGLQHPDQFSSVHDLCKGDEASAIMNSTTEGSSPSVALGTDDQDAIRWYYGDGLNHCGAGGTPTPTRTPTRTNTPTKTPTPAPPTHTPTRTRTPTRTPTPVPGAPVVSSIAATSGPASGGTSITVTGSNFVNGATVKIGGAAATNVAFVDSGHLTCKTPALGAGALYDVVVTNPGNSSGTLAKGWLADFTDVPQAFLYHNAIEKIFRAGITSGCGTGTYCPNDPITRDAMAVFILRGKHGAAFSPPPATGMVFGDVTTGTFLAKWIEEFGNEGFTTGCGGGNYCPTDDVTRDGMSVFLERGKHGTSFSPPAATGNVFCDVLLSTFLAKWMENLKADNITQGCGTESCARLGGATTPDFCPTGTVTRGEMAPFIVRAFGL